MHPVSVSTGLHHHNSQMYVTKCMTKNGAMDTPLDNLDTHVYHQCDLKC